jgi:hypothetical protein
MRFSSYKNSKKLDEQAQGSRRGGDAAGVSADEQRMSPMSELSQKLLLGNFALGLNNTVDSQ